MWVVVQHTRTKAGSIHDRGKGGLVDGGIKPHFNADSPTPEGKKIVRWSEKLDVREFSDEEDDILELTPGIGDTGGEGAINRGRPGTHPTPVRFRNKIGGKHIWIVRRGERFFQQPKTPTGNGRGVFSSREVGC